jgi:hypothetical protein
VSRPWRSFASPLRLGALIHAPGSVFRMASSGYGDLGSIVPVAAAFGSQAAD